MRPSARSAPSAATSAPSRPTPCRRPPANLQTTLTNTTAAQSVIRDTDFAAETANFTKDQVLVQAGTTVLTNANATAQLILNLLK